MVLNPKDRRSDLIHHATIYKDIPRDLPLRCQLPDIIPSAHTATRFTVRLDEERNA